MHPQHAFQIGKFWIGNKYVRRLQAAEPLQQKAAALFIVLCLLREPDCIEQQRKQLFREHTKNGGTIFPCTHGNFVDEIVRLVAVIFRLGASATFRPAFAYGTLQNERVPVRH